MNAPKPQLGARPDGELAVLDGRAQLALEHVERLGVAAVDVRADRGAARIRARLGDPDLVDVGEQRDPHVGPVEDDLLAADDRVRGRADPIGRRVLLVERRPPAVAQPAHVVGEAGARRVEVEVPQLGVARVAEAVDDERRHPDELPGRRGALRVVLELQRELAREDVEDVVVAAVNVAVGAVAARGEARPGRVHRVLLGEDLDAPLGRVADDLAPARRDDGGLAHRRESTNRRLLKPHRQVDAVLRPDEVAVVVEAEVDRRQPSRRDVRDRRAVAHVTVGLGHARRLLGGRSRRPRLPRAGSPVSTRAG
jgi:hypothetical protein